MNIMAAANEDTFSTNENFAELLNDSNIQKEGSVIKGTIVSISKDYITVDVGLKSEGRIPAREFITLGEPEKVAIGDEVEVFLERIENKEGEAVLSREKALREESWERFEAAHKKEEPVDGVIFSRVKGGYTVDLGGAVAFLPGSQVDVRPIKDVSPLMNVTQPFQILKMDRRRGNIVVSRRAILEQSRSAERDEMLSNIAEGQVLEGIVKNITDYGVFIDLGSIDGLLHITDISWRRINHPSEVLSIGDTVKVKVIKFDEENKRVSLGMKQLEDSPWQDIESRYPVGKKLKGRITNITDYGAFVELDPGVEGLVHVSEMSWTKGNAHPSKLVSTSQEVEVMVLDVDPEKHRISLGIKQCESNPWGSFEEKHPIGEKVKGTIKNITDFGIFIGFTDSDVDGLVHISDLTWEESPEEELKKYNKEDEIEVIVLAIEPEKERISLGIKQLAKDPFGEALDKYKKGDVGTFTVSDVNDDGIQVDIIEGCTAFIKRSDLSSERVEQRPERFAVGDRVDAKITSINKKSRKVTLSIKALEAEEQQRAIKEYGSTDSGASLGEILGVALDKSAQDKAEEQPKKAEEKKEAAADAEEKAPAKKAKKAPAKKAAAKKDDSDEASKDDA